MGNVLKEKNGKIVGFMVTSPPPKIGIKMIKMSHVSHMVPIKTTLLPTKIEPLHRSIGGIIKKLLVIEHGDAKQM